MRSRFVQNSRGAADALAALLALLVTAVVSLRRPGTPRVFVLDHDGCRTDRTVPVEATGQGAQFTIGGQYRAVYYEVVYP